MTLPLINALYFLVARHRLIKRLANNHSSLWNKLQIGGTSGEVGGYSGKLSWWVSSKGYESSNDEVLSNLAVSYQKSKLVALPCILISILVMGFLGSAKS